MARFIEDLALMLPIIAGPDPRDPFPIPLRDYSSLTRLARPVHELMPTGKNATSHAYNFVFPILTTPLPEALSTIQSLLALAGSRAIPFGLPPLPVVVQLPTSDPDTVYLNSITHQFSSQTLTFLHAEGW